MLRYDLHAEIVTPVPVTDGTGAGPRNLQFPVKAVVSPASTLLVADKCNNRVQELTFEGQFVRRFPSSSPRAVACSSNASLLAAGSTDSPCTITLHDFPSGELVRSFPLPAVGARATRAEGLRFSLDSTLLYGVCHAGGVVFCCDLTGALIRTYGNGLVGRNCHMDVDFTSSGDLVTYNNAEKEVRVFSGDSGELLRAWPLSGDATALAVANNHLYVLVNRVHVAVFE